MELKDGIYRLPRSIQEDSLQRLEFVLKVWSDLGEAVTKMRLERGDDRYTSPKDFNDILLAVLADPGTYVYVEVHDGVLLGGIVWVSGVSLHYGEVLSMFSCIHNGNVSRLYRYSRENLPREYSVLEIVKFVGLDQYKHSYIKRDSKREEVRIGRD